MGEDDVRQDRRGFLEASVWASSAGIVSALGVPAVRYVATPLTRSEGAVWADLGAPGRLQASGGPVELRYEVEVAEGYGRAKLRSLCVVVPDASAPEGLAVLSPRCTHMGCNVAWDPEASLFLCPCHGGRYDRAGRVVSGPPKLPLARLVTELRDGRLFARVAGA